MKWYLLQTKPRQDEVAERNLCRQNFECIRPLCFIEKLVYGKIVIKQESLFPGYMFVKLEDQQDWSPIRSTLGVRSLVRFGELPVIVPESIINELLERTSVSEVREIMKPGQQVIIESGIFAGLNAVFCCKSGGDRVMLLLDILQSRQKVSVPLSAVRMV